MSNSDPPTLHALQLFLETSYGDVELRALAFAAFGDEPAIFPSLPGAGASGRELAFCVTQLVARHYARPPEALWAYLHATRARRAAEIRRLRAGFEPVEAVASTPEASPAPPEVRSVLPGAARRGSCDLLRCRQPGERDDGTPFALLREGVTNGVARVFSLTWTERVLAVEVTPTLYRGGRRMAARVELPLPLYHEEFLYFPLGRDHCGRDLAAPTLYRFAIERWDRDARSVAFTTGFGQRWCIDL